MSILLAYVILVNIKSAELARELKKYTHGIIIIWSEFARDGRDYMGSVLPPLLLSIIIQLL